MRRFPSRAGPFMRERSSFSGTVYAWISPTLRELSTGLPPSEASDVRRRRTQQQSPFPVLRA